MNKPVRLLRRSSARLAESTAGNQAVERGVQGIKVQSSRLRVRSAYCDALVAPSSFGFILWRFGMSMLTRTLLLALVFVVAPPIYACRCGEGFDFCAWSRHFLSNGYVMFLAEVLEGTGERRHVVTGPPAKVRVLENLVGLDSVDTVLTVNPSLMTSCSFEMRTGEQWLLIGTRSRDPSLDRYAADIHTGGCTGSFRIDQFPKLYSALRNSIVRGREAIVGKASIAKVLHRSTRSAAGLTLTATNGNALRHSIVDANGEFEFLDIAPGDWQLHIADEHHVLHSMSPDKPIAVPQGGCVYRDLSVFPNGQISGVVFDRSGLPVPNVPVQAFVTEFDGRKGSNPLRTVATDAYGMYRLSGLPEGEVYLAVNGNEYKDTHPYAPVFYPGVASRELATAIILPPGGKRTAIDLTVGPARHPVRIAVNAILEDGSRPDTVFVTLKDARNRIRASDSLSMSERRSGSPLALTAYAGEQYLLEASAYVRQSRNGQSRQFVAEVVLDTT
ncbi:MAG: carboxypeptidase-like regulatory domain-containing protein, partial [Bryobacterales bacterium]|nr:carboxypeptidase-like regulatory domain-containing protein [Bryobacterales bacterium]